MSTNKKVVHYHQYHHHYISERIMQAFTYQDLCNSTLTYMWNQLALTYSRRAFRRCANPRCEGVLL